MQELHARAHRQSGIPRSAVDEARNANLYAKLGEETFHKLSRNFYARVYDDEGWFRGLFANTTSEAAQRNQREFLIQEFGGPNLYQRRKGHTALLGRHGPYAIEARAAKRWLTHMSAALEESVDDEQARGLLKDYFGHMAWIVVFGRELVNPSRTVGYYGKHQEGQA